MWTEFDPARPDLYPARDAFFGELTANLLKAPLALLALWLVTLLPWFPRLTFDQNLGIVVLGTAFLCTAGFAARRFFEVRAGRSAPGGFGYAVVPALFEPAAGFLGGHIVTRSMSGAWAATLAYAVVALVFFVWLKPWQEGRTRAEDAAKMTEFKAMTQAHFADDLEKKRAESKRLGRAYWGKQLARQRRREARRRRG